MSLISEPTTAGSTNPFQRLSQEISELGEITVDLMNSLDRIDDVLFGSSPKVGGPSGPDSAASEGKIDQFTDRLRMSTQMIARARDLANTIEKQIES